MVAESPFSIGFIFVTSENFKALGQVGELSLGQLDRQKKSFHIVRSFQVGAKLT